MHTFTTKLDFRVARETSLKRIKNGKLKYATGGSDLEASIQM